MNTKTKTCKKCGKVKPISEFGTHKNMKSGIVNKCKECTKEYFREYRRKNIEKIKEYDKARVNNNNRYEYRKEYRRRPETKARVNSMVKKWKEKHPERKKAHSKVSNAIRDGRLTRPDRCEMCGHECTPHAHHWSYEEEHWLDVEWLCVVCHMQLHHSK